MKSKLLGNLLLNALSTGFSSNYVNRIPNTSGYNRNYGTYFRLQNRNRNRNRIIQVQNSRNNRRRKGQGIEINRAEGGYKNITLPYRTQTIGINTYGRIAINKVGEDWLYAFQPSNDNYANHVEYNIITMLNDSQEFKDRLKTTSQYRINRICICIMNNRIPEAGDKLSRLLAYVNTTKVAVIDPKVQNNVMRLSMSTMGVKNFNFRLTNESIGKDFTGWFEGEDLYTGNVYLHFDSEDSNNIKDETETTIVLGTVKITFEVLTRIQDYTRLNQPTKKLTDKEKIELLEKQIAQIKLDPNLSLKFIEEEQSDTRSLNKEKDPSVTSQIVDNNEE